MINRMPNHGDIIRFELAEVYAEYRVEIKGDILTMSRKSGSAIGQQTYTFEVNGFVGTFNCNFTAQYKHIIQSGLFGKYKANLLNY